MGLIATIVAFQPASPFVSRPRTTLNAKFDDEQMAQLAELLGEFEKRMNTRMGELKTSVGWLETSMGELNTTMGELKTSVGGLETKTGGLYE